jgi:hypothetical protein
MLLGNTQKQKPIWSYKGYLKRYLCRLRRQNIILKPMRFS